LLSAPRQSRTELQFHALVKEHVVAVEHADEVEGLFTGRGIDPSLKALPDGSLP
jgi:hypothetical protein